MAALVLRAAAFAAWLLCAPAFASDRPITLARADELLRAYDVARAILEGHLQTPALRARLAARVGDRFPEVEKELSRAVWVAHDEVVRLEAAGADLEQVQAILSSVDAAVVTLQRAMVKHGLTFVVVYTDSRAANRAHTRERRSPNQEMRR